MCYQPQLIITGKRLRTGDYYFDLVACLLAIGLYSQPHQGSGTIVEEGVAGREGEGGRERRDGVLLGRFSE